MAWDDIQGQGFAKRVLQTHLSHACVAGAYLLIGPEGIGKRRLALEMAKALNCTAEGNRPCDRCPTCTQIARGSHPDVYLVVPGGASEQIGIDRIRLLLGRIALRPFSAATHVVVIDGAERLTEEAANGLLKSLEEPSARTRFLLTTSQLSHCLPTIVSRCQLLRCQPLPREVVQRLLTDTQGCDPQVARAVAKVSRGSASRAINLASRWTDYHAVVERLATEPASSWMERPLPETRQEVMGLLEGMIGWLRDVSMAAAAASVESEWLAHTAQEGSVRDQARTVDADRCVEAVFELIELRSSLDAFVSPRLVAALAREKWLGLVTASRDVAGHPPTISGGRPVR